MIYGILLAKIAAGSILLSTYYEVTERLCDQIEKATYN